VIRTSLVVKSAYESFGSFKVGGNMGDGNCVWDVEWKNLVDSFFVGGEMPLEVTVERRVEDETLGVSNSGIESGGGAVGSSCRPSGGSTTPVVAIESINARR